MRRLILMTAALCAAVPGAIAQALAAPAQPDPKEMSREDLEAEVGVARQILAAGAVRSGRRGAGCTSPESRQFDFWLGEWDAGPTGTSVFVAESSITLEAQGCVIVENWRPFAGPHGFSLNMYDAKTKQWHQEWMDATGRHTPYKGVVEEDGVLRYERLDGPWADKTIKRQRMNFEKVDADTVRQWGENYSAKTKEWSVAWDLTYHRRPGTR